MLRGESEIGINEESLRSKGHKNNLKDENDTNYKQKYFVFSDIGKNINLFVYLSAVKEVEDLHHHEYIEYHCEMS